MDVTTKNRGNFVFRMKAKKEEATTVSRKNRYALKCTLNKNIAEPPYHPTTNGQMERNSCYDIERLYIHQIPNTTPTERILNRELRTLDLLLPTVIEEVRRKNFKAEMECCAETVWTLFGRRKAQETARRSIGEYG